MTFLKNIQSQKFYFITLLALSAFMTGCFDNVDASKAMKNLTQGPVSDITADQFLGATNAINKVTGIEVSWAAATGGVSSYRVYRLKGNTMELMTSVGSEITSVVDGSVTWGALYTYIVRAVDSKGIEDTNEKRVSSLSWGGLDSVVSESSTSIKVVFDNSSAAANEIRIYIQPASGGDKKLVAAVSPSEGQYTINELKPGYKYLVSAQAFVATLKKEDGNLVTWPIATNTQGFHDNGTDLAKWRNVISARAFGDSPGAPIHPVIPDKSPRKRVVELTFNSFNGLGPSQKYVVIRAPEGMPIDTNASESCTDTTARSCRPCGVLQGNAALFCRDTNVADSPARYRYTMAIVHSEAAEEWVEPLPADKIENFSVLVPIPPKNMVLVQRDAANYEMCAAQMNRFADPKNKNRCEYSGAGAVPFNSGIGKSALNLNRNYYDFGYNLFVDRYPMSCNWTTAAAGGKCGAGGTDGDCVMSGAYNTAPSNTLGVDGNVMWLLTPYTSYLTIGSSYCFVKSAGTWKTINNLQAVATNAKELLSSALTEDPLVGHPRKPVSMVVGSPATSMVACQAKVDPYYGAKRMSRLREWRVYSAFPTVPGEPYSMTYSQAASLNNGGKWNAVDGFRCQSGAGLTAEHSLTISPSLSSMLTSTTNEMTAYMNGSQLMGNIGFVAGSKSTSDCVSRYGAQDVINGYTPTSDVFLWNPTSQAMRGMASPLDSGNFDLLTDALGGNSGYLLDGNQFGLTGTAPYQYRSSYLVSAAFNFINLALGFPAFVTTSSQYLPRSSFTDNFGAAIILPYIAQAEAAVFPAVGPSRWYTRMLETSITSTYSLGGVYRCVLPAE